MSIQYGHIHSLRILFEFHLLSRILFQKDLFICFLFGPRKLEYRFFADSLECFSSDRSIFTLGGLMVNFLSFLQFRKILSLAVYF